ncbi:BPI fold-containing family C protein-like [Liasis olivaceus]
MKVSVIFLILSLPSLLLEANPGIKVKITKKALDYGKQSSIEFLKQRLKEETFKDQSGQDTYGFIGFNYTVSKIKIDNVELPNTSLSLISGTGINIVVKDASATVSADWSVKTWLFKHSGRGSFFISGVSVTAVVKVFQSVSGCLKLSLESCEGVVADVDIKLNQAYRWLHTYFTTSLVEPLCIFVGSSLCPKLDSEIQLLNEEFSKCPAQTQISPFEIVDYSLINSSAISESSVDLDLKVTFYPVEKITEPPFKPTTFDLPDENNSMLYVGVSEYFFQSALLAYYTSRGFDNSAEQDERLSSYFNLTTDTLKNIIPTIAHLYAEPLPVIMSVGITDVPVISLHNDKLILEFAGSMAVLAMLPNSTTQSMFTLNIIAGTHANLTIFDQRLIITLCLDSFHISLAHSDIGFFEASLLDNFVSYILQTGIILAANAKLKDGIPLPLLDTMILMKPNVRIYQGFLLISTDMI